MAEPKPTSVCLERWFAVPPGKVWQGWTDAALVRQWFGSDPAGTVSAVQLAVQPGGTFKVCFADSDGSEHTCSGVYVDVVPGKKLSFSWHWANEPGVGTFVGISLESCGAGTQMNFVHSGLGDASSHDYAAGWQRTFDKLARALSPKA